MGILDFFKSTPTPERFCNIASDALRASGFSAPIQIDQAEFRLLLGQDASQIFNLNNLYRDYCRVPKGERAQVLDKYIKSMAPPGLPASFAEARARLMPLLRSRSMVEYVALSVSDKPVESTALPAAQTFSADAATMLAYDTEHAIMTLNGSTLADWGVSFDTALAAAVDNLRDATISNFQQITPGLYLGTWDDAYDTSRLLFPDVVYQLGMGGEPLAMIPTRGRFLVASSNDRDAQLLMIELARKFVEEEGRPLSALMYRYENGRAVACQPSDPEVAIKLGDLRRKTMADDYASQKDMLEKSHEKNGIDLFVASYRILVSDRTGLQTSFAVWTENVDTLLPEADMVALVSTAQLEDGSAGKQMPKMVAWQDLQDAIGGLEQLPERYPARYRTGQFPDQATRDALPANEL